MPDGSVVEADNDELLSLRSYYSHNPHVAQEEHDEALRQKQADELLQKHLAGEELKDDQLAFVKEVFPEVFKKRRRAKPKATKPDPKITKAHKKSLTEIGINSNAPSEKKASS
jgi:hypothetical protein